MKFSTKACIVAAVTAMFTLVGPSAYAMQDTGRTWAKDMGRTWAKPMEAKDDPCPGQHVQVYTANNNKVSPHFVCGTPGTQGPAGPQGEPGKDGVDGKDGKDGAQGPAGEKGDIGPAGPQGPAGDAGAQGPQGDPGVAGPAGDPGLDGATGPAGPAGVPGVPGDRGVDGKDGKNGKTIYLTQNPDGSTDEVDPLPATGGDNDAWWIALAALGLIGGGIALAVLLPGYRKVEDES